MRGSDRGGTCIVEGELPVMTTCKRLLAGGELLATTEATGPLAMSISENKASITVHWRNMAWYPLGSRLELRMRLRLSKTCGVDGRQAAGSGHITEVCKIQSLNANPVISGIAHCLFVGGDERSLLLQHHCSHMHD